jgi:hypothetical protein
MGPRAVLPLLGLLVLATVGLLLLLDGEEDEPPRRDTKSAAPPAAPEEAASGPVDAVALRSARALARGFERVTGDRLELEPGEYFTSAAFHERTPDEHGQAEAYYGNFLLFAYPTAAAARGAVRRQGPWSSYGSGWYRRTTLHDVVVQSVFERRGTDPAWGRLLRALRAARAPGAVELPRDERLCARLGIRLDAGPTGTCKRGPQRFTIREREMGLRLPGIAIEDVRMRRGPRFGTRGGLVDGARGEFVELRFRVRNTGRAAIETRPGYELVVAGRRFEEHSAVYGLRDRYPLRPGDEDTDVTLFDVPRGLDLERAALQLPGGPAASLAVSDGLVVGHLRLAGPVGRLRLRPGREPAPRPMPEPEPPPEPQPDPGLPEVTPA